MSTALKACLRRFRFNGVTAGRNGFMDRPTDGQAGGRAAGCLPRRRTTRQTWMDLNQLGFLLVTVVRERTNEMDRTVFRRKNPFGRLITTATTMLTVGWLVCPSVCRTIVSHRRDASGASPGRAGAGRVHGPLGDARTRTLREKCPVYGQAD